MTWSVLYLLHADLAKFLVCWLVVPIAIWLGLIRPVLAGMRPYWDN